MAETDMESDAELVKVALNGDRQAYGELFRRHERSVLAIALGILGDYHAAQDIAQNAFVTAYCLPWSPDQRTGERWNDRRRESPASRRGDATAEA